MAALPLLWLPLATLCLLVVVGAGVTSRLGTRFPADAQIALAAPVGAAILACASPALHFGLSPVLIAGSVLVIFGALTITSARRLSSVSRHAAVPVVVALVAVVVTAAPWLARGNWDAAAIVTTDPYLWVSEAKALLDGPAPEPAADHPDRLATDRIDALHWPVGLPFGVAQVAMLADRDPANVYGAWAVVLAVLIVLAVYAAARGCLEWSRRLAAVAGFTLATNALVLYSTLNGWQAQVALTTFGTLALVTYRMALDRGAPRSEMLLAGLFLAAAAAVYGSLIGPFLLMLVAAAVGYAALHRPVELRRLVSTTATVAFAALVVGLEPLVRAARQLTVWSTAADDTGWDAYAHALPMEAMGLVPRIYTAYRPPFAWTVLAAIAGAGILFLALRSLRSARGPRGDLLLSVGGGSLVLIALLSAPGPSPYVSLKFAAYAAPVVTLLALSAVAGQNRFRRTRVAVLGVAGFCFVASTALVYEQARRRSLTLEPLRSLTASVEQLPTEERIGIALSDPWVQSWTVYVLRDRKVTVVDPTIYLTGFGLETPRLSRARYDYVVDVDEAAHEAGGGDRRAAPVRVRKVTPVATTLLAGGP